MADCDYDGQPEEIDEFAMFRARALGAESEYLLMQQASRRGSPRPDSRQFQSNGAVNEQLSSSNISGSVASVDGQPMTRTSSGRRRHASGQGTSSSRARRAVQSSSAAAADNDESVAASRDQIQAVNGSVTTIDGCSSTSGQVRRRTAAGRQQLDRRTDSSSSGYQQKMLLVSPGSFDDDGDMNGLQRPLQVNIITTFDSSHIS